MLNDDQKRAEFLRKNSPLRNNNIPKVSAPPLFEEPIKSLDQSKLSNTIETPKSIFEEPVNHVEKDRFNLIFWRNWDTNHYAFASIGLAAMLMLYVGLSFYNNMNTVNLPELNATLNVNQEPITEENQTNLNEFDSENLINEDIIDSSIVIEEIQNDSLNVREPDLTEYVLENYDI